MTARTRATSAPAALAYTPAAVPASITSPQVLPRGDSPSPSPSVAVAVAADSNLSTDADRKITQPAAPLAQNATPTESSALPPVDLASTHPGEEAVPNAADEAAETVMPTALAGDGAGPANLVSEEKTPTAVAGTAAIAASQTETETEAETKSMTESEAEVEVQIEVQVLGLTADDEGKPHAETLATTVDTKPASNNVRSVVSAEAEAGGDSNTETDAGGSSKPDYQGALLDSSFIQPCPAPAPEPSGAVVPEEVNADTKPRVARPRRKRWLLSMPGKRRRSSGSSSKNAGALPVVDGGVSVSHAPPKTVRPRKPRPVAVTQPVRRSPRGFKLEGSLGGNVAGTEAAGSAAGLAVIRAASPSPPVLAARPILGPIAAAAVTVSSLAPTAPEGGVVRVAMVLPRQGLPSLPDMKAKNMKRKTAEKPVAKTTDKPAAPPSSSYRTRGGVKRAIDAAASQSKKARLGV